MKDVKILVAFCAVLAKDTHTHTHTHIAAHPPRVGCSSALSRTEKCCVHENNNNNNNNEHICIVQNKNAQMR